MVSAAPSWGYGVVEEASYSMYSLHQGHMREYFGLYVRIHNVAQRPPPSCHHRRPACRPACHAAENRLATRWFLGSIDVHICMYLADLSGTTLTIVKPCSQLDIVIRNRICPSRSPQLARL